MVRIMSRFIKAFIISLLIISEYEFVTGNTILAVFYGLFAINLIIYIQLKDEIEKVRKEIEKLRGI